LRSENDAENRQRSDQPVSEVGSERHRQLNPEVEMIVKPNQILMAIGIALVAVAFVKFSFIGYRPEEGATFAGVAILGAGALGLADLAKSRLDGWRRRPDLTAI
jgi:hypothetical protein